MMMVYEGSSWQKSGANIFANETNMMIYRFQFLCLLCLLQSILAADESLAITQRTQHVVIPDYQTDSFTVGPELTFHGIGALSGGGATARLLIDYPEPQRSEILDILFKPSFAASLHILKVEIGGDSQSTDGTESSHMHSENDLDCTRGYEWWLLREAKRRNPNIITYGLPWAFPGWVKGDDGEGNNPFSRPDLTASYIVEWLRCARDTHGVDIDLVGLWNECGNPGQGENEYAKLLRRTLDEEGFADTKIVAKDNDFSVCEEMANDQEYNDAIHAIGLHYPSDYPADNYDGCHKLEKPFWSSEESSSYADNNGAACWARVISSHFVLSGMTSNIMWNLVGSYTHGTNWYNSALFGADQAWSGYYERDDSAPVVWATAHYTHFTEPGWTYLPVGKGSGELGAGGFYNALISPDKRDFTLIITNISRDHAECTRPRLPGFDTDQVQLHVRLPQSARDKPLHQWRSNFERDDGQYFEYLGPANVDSNGLFIVMVEVGDVWTVSTIDTAQKGTFDTPLPKSNTQFPLPYQDDFEAYRDSREARYFTDQIGTFEIHSETIDTGGTLPSKKNHFMRQMVPTLPVGWMGNGANARGPVSIIGTSEMNDISLSAKFRIPSQEYFSSGAVSGCIGGRVNMYFTQGVVLCVQPLGEKWTLSYGGPLNGGGYPDGAVISSGDAPVDAGLNKWQTLNLTIRGEEASGSLNGHTLFTNIAIRDGRSGFGCIGTSHWNPIEFDDFSITSAAARNLPQLATPSFYDGQLIGATPCARNGVADLSQSFDARYNWQLYHKPSGLCVEAGSTSEASSVRLASCNEDAQGQKFRNRYTNIRNWPVELTLGGWNVLDNDLKLVGYKNGAVAVTPGGEDEDWNSWSFFPNTGQVRNTYDENRTLGYPYCLAVLADESNAVDQRILRVSDWMKSIYFGVLMF